jgi:hypothetical protein
MIFKVLTFQSHAHVPTPLKFFHIYFVFRGSKQMCKIERISTAPTPFAPRDFSNILKRSVDFLDSFGKHRALFTWVSKEIRICFRFAKAKFRDFKISRYFLFQSKLKPKVIATFSYYFSRTLCRLCVFGVLIGSLGFACPL